MNDDSVTRIGRGVPVAPPPAPGPPRRRAAWFLVAAGVFVGVGLAGLLFRDEIFGRPVPMPVASTPSLKVLDEQATCVLVVPVARDGAQLVLDATRNPDTVDWLKMQKAHDDLVAIAPIAAPTLRDDITQQAATLSQLLSLSRSGGKLTFEFTAFKESGLRIGARCDRYAG